MNTTAQETRVAILEDDLLVELMVDRPDSARNRADRPSARPADRLPGSRRASPAPSCSSGSLASPPTPLPVPECERPPVLDGRAGSWRATRPTRVSFCDHRPSSGLPVQLSEERAGDHHALDLAR